jgi:hypothetical protein
MGECENWIHLARDRDQWRALVNTATNMGLVKHRGITYFHFPHVYLVG